MNRLSPNAVPFVPSGAPSLLRANAPSYTPARPIPNVRLVGEFNRLVAQQRSTEPAVEQVNMAKRDLIQKLKSQMAKQQWRKNFANLESEMKGARSRRANRKSRKANRKSRKSRKTRRA
jgi:hypothetical protein